MRTTSLPNMEAAPMWPALEWEYTRCVTLEGLPLARVTSWMARSRLCPMVGGASTSTTPSLVVRNMAW